MPSRIFKLTTELKSYRAQFIHASSTKVFITTRPCSDEIHINFSLSNQKFDLLATELVPHKSKLKDRNFVTHSEQNPRSFHMLSVDTQKLKNTEYKMPQNFAKYDPQHEHKFDQESHSKGRTCDIRKLPPEIRLEIYELLLPSWTEPCLWSFFELYYMGQEIRLEAQQFFNMKLQKFAQNLESRKMRQKASAWELLKPNRTIDNLDINQLEHGVSPLPISRLQDTTRSGSQQIEMHPV